MKKFRITELLISIIGAELVGALSLLVAGGNIGEYFSSLVRPPLSPPSAVFAIVWPVLYALMGYSVYLVYLSENKYRNKALRLYAAQLFINFLWMPIFLGLKSFIGGLAVIILLDVAVALMIAEFSKIRRKAALLNLPYMIWCIYATYLTAGLYILNR